MRAEKGGLRGGRGEAVEGMVRGGGWKWELKLAHLSAFLRRSLFGGKRGFREEGEEGIRGGWEEGGRATGARGRGGAGGRGNRGGGG